MSEAPMKVVVDCSAPDKERELSLIGETVERVLEGVRAGEVDVAEAETQVRDLLAAAAQVQAAPERERLVPLSEEELEQRRLAELEAVEIAWASLRGSRNARLAASDWTQLADAAPLLGGADKEAAWREYRQLLRDLPGKTEDPFNPVWPFPPA